MQNVGLFKQLIEVDFISISIVLIRQQVIIRQFLSLAVEISLCVYMILNVGGLSRGLLNHRLLNVAEEIIE